MAAADVVEVGGPHDANIVRCQTVDALVEIVDLEDRHVAAGAVALVEQPLHGRALTSR